MTIYEKAAEFLCQQSKRDFQVTGKLRQGKSAQTSKRRECLPPLRVRHLDGINEIRKRRLFFFSQFALCLFRLQHIALRPRYQGQGRVDRLQQRRLRFREDIGPQTQAGAVQQIGRDISSLRARNSALEG